MLRLLAVAVGLFLVLLVGEVAARIWVAWRWPAERIELLTTHSSVRGRFASHPYLPFVLNPAFPGHNDSGFRGKPLAISKPPGVRRVACIGASTTYGTDVQAEEAYPAQLAVLLAEHHGPWESINAGVPGYVSTEILLTLLLRVLAFDPDVVVFLEGRNEVFPQAYNNFAADYSHYRRPGFSYTVSNYGHKLLFSWSRLAMLTCTLGGGHFGWSEAEEHPLYGGICWTNRPSPSELVHNLADPARMITWRQVLVDVAAVCKARGILPVFCTMACVPAGLALNDELKPDADLQALFARQVERNNAVVREVGAQSGATVVEGSVLSQQPELFLDDCHVNAKGNRLRAELVYAALVPLLTKGQ
jgi:lysophospholipase L1-like esterase